MCEVCPQIIVFYCLPGCRNGLEEIFWFSGFWRKFWGGAAPTQEEIWGAAGAPGGKLRTFLRPERNVSAARRFLLQRDVIHGRKNIILSEQVEIWNRKLKSELILSMSCKIIVIATKKSAEGRKNRCSICSETFKNEFFCRFFWRKFFEFSGHLRQEEIFRAQQKKTIT